MISTDEDSGISSHDYEALSHVATPADSEEPHHKTTRNNAINGSKPRFTANPKFEGLPNQNQHENLQIYWLSPTMMIGSFLLGTGLAIGHHIYYQSLNGQAVGSFDRQQWSLRYVALELPLRLCHGC